MARGVAGKRESYPSLVSDFRGLLRRLGHFPDRGRSQYANQYWVRCLICGEMFSMKRSRIKQREYRTVGVIGSCRSKLELFQGEGI